MVVGSGNHASRICLHLLLLLLFSVNVAFSGTLVTSLPGFDGDLPFKLYTGYVNMTLLFFCVGFFLMILLIGLLWFSGMSMSAPVMLRCFTISSSQRGTPQRTLFCSGIVAALVALLSTVLFMKMVPFPFLMLQTEKYVWESDIWKWTHLAYWTLNII